MVTCYRSGAALSSIWLDKETPRVLGIPLSMSMTCFQRSFACGTATDVLLSRMLETWRGQSRGREKLVTPAYSLSLPFFFPPFFPPPFSVSLPPLAATRLASFCDVALPQVHTIGASPFLWSGRTAIFDHTPKQFAHFMQQPS